MPGIYDQDVCKGDFYSMKYETRASRLAYQLRTRFDSKITAYYMNTFKGIYGSAQVNAINFINENKSVKPQQLADILSISKQHASKILSALEDDGLLCREIDKNDRRSCIYRFTDKGRDFSDAHVSASNFHFDESFNKLPPEKQLEMIEAMEKLVDILDIF